jgi:D-glycero-D-manno-heptose 1,7-bisphosphate phosphatase
MAGVTLGRPVRAAVFLDRDGTVIRTEVRDGVPRPPVTPATMHVLPGVPAALKRLKAAGLLLIVVTNQPDVRRGTLRRAVVEEMHARLQRCLPLDAISCCYHDDLDDCACRKPRPGMLVDAADRFGLDLHRCFMVGDRWRDIEAGRRAGCTTVLLRQPYSEPHRAQPDFEAATLPEAADIILRCVEGWSGEAVRR